MRYKITYLDRRGIRENYSVGYITREDAEIHLALYSSRRGRRNMAVDFGLQAVGSLKIESYII